MSPLRCAILISGSGSNMEAIVKESLTGCLKKSCEISLVISNKPDVGGLEKANALGIPTAVVESANKSKQQFESELLQLLQPLQPDYIILAGFMRILSAEFIRHYPQRIINIHPADTGKYQGPHGYEWAFNSGLKVTSITVHYVDEGIDTGAIIAQTDVDLTGLQTIEEVKTKGLKIEHQFYSQVLLQVIKNRKRV